MPGAVAPSRRLLLVAALCPAAVLGALAFAFGVVDHPGFGEDRCAGCGVEGYVMAAHVAAALALAALVAGLSALRNRALHGRRAPGRPTLAGLGVAGVFVAASLAWHPLFTAPGLVAFAAGALFGPVVLVWWAVIVVTIWRRRHPATADARRALGALLAGAWVSLAVLLPAVYTAVYLDRVAWFTF